MKTVPVKPLYLLLLLLCFYREHAYSQSTVSVDSLEAKLNLQPSGKPRIELLLQLSKELSDTNYKRALVYAHEAILIAEHEGTVEQLAEAVRIAGKCTHYLGLVAEAAKYQVRYLELIRSKGTPLELATAYTNLGAIWISTGEYRKAGNFFIKALEQLELKSSDTSAKLFQEEKAVIFNNLGIIYSKTGDFTKATEVLEKGITLARNEPKLQLELIRLLNNYGELLMNSNRFNEARTALNEALQLSTQSGNKAMQVASFNIFSKLFEETNRLDSSISFAKKGYLLAKELDYPSLVFYLASQLKDVFEKNHQTDSSFRYQKVEQQYALILKEKEARDLLLEQELRAEFQQKEQLLLSEYERKKLWLWFTFGILFLIAVIMALLYIITRYKMRKTEHEKLELELMAESFEKEKKLLYAELETKNKELTGKVMMQIQRTELIEEIIGKLLLQEKFGQDTKSIINALRSLKDEDVWKEFESRFTQVDTNFFNKLRTLNPDLTLNERRLCALLRMDMSTKEIAAITHQSIRALEIARTRLRKKLGLTNTEKSLTEFLTGL